MTKMFFNSKSNILILFEVSPRATNIICKGRVPPTKPKKKFKKLILVIPKKVTHT